MTIGIDLSSLQGAHRMRGIGYTLINLINNVSSADRQKHHFVFYAHPDNGNEGPLDILDLTGFDYEIRYLSTTERFYRRNHEAQTPAGGFNGFWPKLVSARQWLQRRLPQRLQRLLTSFSDNFYAVIEHSFGDARFNDSGDLDVFLQTNPSASLPRSRHMKKVLIIYDIIPYVLEWEYLWSYKTARRHGFSRKAAFRVHVRRWLYAYKVKVNTKRADVLLAISEHTKQDFVRYLGINKKRVVVKPLGINLPDEKSIKKVALKHYVKTSWGYMKRSLSLDPEVPFVLYVGGADKRRKLEDLVAAFNILRAQGINFKLVLAGDCMQGPENIATEEIQHAMKISSYKDDIIFMGFVDDKTRDWLYDNARAFVFPSRYEGFGLPVLEAMSYGTPVISYDNAATKEVAKDCPTYVNDTLGLADAMKKYLNYSLQRLEKEHDRNVAQARKWTWAKTSQVILDKLSGLA